ncbi:hypothetical protein V6N13_043591 [Hibiscus sabdariffa]
MVPRAEPLRPLALSPNCGHQQIPRAKPDQTAPFSSPFTAVSAFTGKARSVRFLLVPPCSASILAKVSHRTAARGRHAPPVAISGHRSNRPCRTGLEPVDPGPNRFTQPNRAHSRTGPDPTRDPPDPTRSRPDPFDPLTESTRVNSVLVTLPTVLLLSPVPLDLYNLVIPLSHDPRLLPIVIRIPSSTPGSPDILSMIIESVDTVYDFPDLLLKACSLVTVYCYCFLLKLLYDIPDLLVPTLRPRVNLYGPKISVKMSTRRGRRPARARGRPARYADPIDVPIPDPPPPVDPPAPEVPPVPRGQTAVTDPPPAPSIDVTTPVRGASAVGPQPVAGLFDENLGRQFLQLIQGAVRVANVVPEVPISQTLISSGVRTFTGSPNGAPTDAEDWLRDTERRMDQLGFDPAKKYQRAVSMLDGNAHVWWEFVVTSVSADRLTWEFFRDRFKSRFIGERFLRRMKQEFQNLRQGSRTMAEYELEFLRLLQYGSSLVPTESDRCQKFREGLRIDILKQVATHQDTVFDVLVERAKAAEEVELLLRQTDRAERERPRRPYGPGESSSRPGKRVRAAVPQRSNTGSRPTVQQTPAVSRGDSSGFTPLPPCEHCGNRHGGECRKKTGACFRCGSSEHFLRDCPQPSSAARTSAQTPARSQTSVQTPARGRTQSRVSGSASRADRSHPQQSRGPVLLEARQPALVYATRRRDDRDEPDVIAGCIVDVH